MKTSPACRLAPASLPLLALLASAGCSVTFAPPVRAIQYGAPGRLAQGEVELGGAAGGLAGPPLVGGPQVAYGIRDWVSVEGGGNFLLLEGSRNWAMGWLGPRFTLAPRKRTGVWLAGDLELGGGAGLGGVLHNNGTPCQEGTMKPDGCEALADGKSWPDRTAWGGYVGGGVGLHIHWFSIFARARLEESTATNVPLTLWPTVIGGIEFDIQHRVALGFSGGLLGYTNTTDNGWGGFYQLSATIFLDTPAKQRATGD